MAPAQTRLDQIRNLVNEWEQLTGFTISFNDWAINEMAGKPGEFETIYDIGRFAEIYSGSLWWQFIPEHALDKIPWAKFGMSSTEYNAKLEAYDTAFQTLAGTSAPPDLVERALKEHQGVMSGSQFQTWLLAQDAIKNTYGWLKYGLDFEQFQAQKLQMRSSFGRDLSDAEAVTQLQYQHAAQGPNVSVAAAPTLSQQERRSANVGEAQSVVR
jgi:hypothetical protein